MDSPTWSWRLLLKYALLQLPDLLLVVVALVLVQRWTSVPSWLFWSIIAVWLAKDVALFPLVWRSYTPTPSTPAPSPIGEVGVTRERLAPTGYIRVRGTLWRAELAGDSPPLEAGHTVRVQERRGLTLIVVPEEDAS